MFIASTLLYPCALAVLCIGAGLLVERAGGATLPGSLLPAVGAAALVALTQLTTFIVALAPASPYLAAAFALAGLALGRARAAAIARAARARALSVAGPVAVYAIAIAPVLVVGRPSFSSFMALSDSAVHIMGADYLIHHGQSYGALDLHNSYGQFVRAYWGSGYPSGADTLFGATALLLRLPLIWAFQPLNAFLLACAFGPARLLAGRVGLRGAWSAFAALAIVLGALVYGYELIGSVKEVAALAMLLCAGALLALEDRWRGAPTRAAIPLALVLAAGVDVLGAAFGVWGLAVAVVLAAVLGGEVVAGRASIRDAVLLAGTAVAVGLVAALPTLVHLSSSIAVAGNIASTGNPGNLHSPLHKIQVFGVWLDATYKQTPKGAGLDLSHALIGLAAALALIGAVQVLRVRALALAGWLALSLAAWLVVSASVTTWASAKTLMLTSPVVGVLVVAGLAALHGAGPRAPRGWLACVAAVALLAGVVASDFMQYRASNLAPTARYTELARVGERFAGQGPALFTDFDEYSLYELRRLDIGGPDFVYPPPALAAAGGGYGQPVRLDRVAPGALASYPLIVSRREPAAVRPPAAYTLVWRGAYYEVWRRATGAAGAPALVHVALQGSPAARCLSIGAVARAAPGASNPPGGPGSSALAAAAAPAAAAIDLGASSHPRAWGRQRGGLVMNRAGTMRATVALPSSGAWDLWVQGQLMPAVAVSVDGRRVATIAGQLSGNSLVPNTVPPLRVELAAGRHSLTVQRFAATLAPGERGAAVLAAVVLTRDDGTEGTVTVVGARDWRRLCRTPREWVERLTPVR